MTQAGFFDPPAPRAWTMPGALRTIEYWWREAEKAGMEGRDALRWATHKAWDEIEAGREIQEPKILQ